MSNYYWPPGNQFWLNPRGYLARGGDGSTWNVLGAGGGMVAFETD